MTTNVISVMIARHWIYSLLTAASRLMLVFVCGFLFHSCENRQQPYLPLLLAKSPEETGITFRNQLFENDRLNILTWEYFYNGGGVGSGDFDNDGLEDLIFTSNMGDCALYRNLGHFQFEDVTPGSGINTQGQWASGVSLVDINADGLLDIYICVAGPYPPEERANLLYLNQGYFSFREVAEEVGLADRSHSTQAAFFDYDKDGDLDCYLLTNMMEDIGPNVIRPKKMDGSGISTDKLYRNDGGLFTDVSTEAGITVEGYGLGISVCDLNEDGWPDLYISNDYLSNDLLWINQQDGSFRDEASRYFRHTSYSAMGHDIGDINADGRPDLFTVDMLPPDNLRKKLMFGATNYDRFRSEIQAGYAPQYMKNTLQLNRGWTGDSVPVFAEVSELAGVAATDWSWSARFADLDLDGWEDLLITNGYPRDITNRDFADYKAGQLFGGQAADLGMLATKLRELPGVYLPNVVFRNTGGCTFSDQSREWGFTQPSFSHGMVCTDLDNDGDLDVVINNLEDPPFVYDNQAIQSGNGSWLRIKLTGPTGNPFGFGAEIHVWAGERHHVQRFEPVRGYQSSQTQGIHVGLGEYDAADSIAIRWPDGKWQWLTQVQANQVLNIRHQASSFQNPSQPQRPDPVFSRQTEIPDFVHVDPEYPDFHQQPLLHRKFSESGPPLVTGDVNADGLEDVFVGGAFRQSGQVFVQQSDGSFEGTALDPTPALFEDVGATFFDADGDLDLDLYVVSGSNELPTGHEGYRDRLYLNDGSGAFTPHAEGLPEIKENGSVVVPLDVNRDGQMDLFVGGRMTPHSYPAIPGSHLLINDGKAYFSDQTILFAPDLQQIGMVTSAVAHDWNEDGWTDLMLAGEWMPLTIAFNRDGKLDSLIEIPNSSGWWNSLALADLDGDGDMDAVGGNWGRNLRLKASDDFPLRLYVGDVNRDGREEGILCHNLNGEEVPVAARDDMLRQFPFLKRQFQDYQHYAEATWADLFSEDIRREMKVLEAVTLSSCWVEYDQGEWVLHELPLEAQMSTVHDAISGDWNRDGLPDLILVGNTRSADVQTGYLDASGCVFLAGMGGGEFEAMLPEASGCYLSGNARSIQTIRQPDGQPIMLISVQNGRLLGFRPRHSTSPR